MSLADPAPELELTLTVEDGKTVVARIVPPADQEEGEEKHVSDLDPLRMATIEVFNEWLRAGKLTKRKELEVLGGHLYRHLFGDKVEDLFMRSLARVPKQKRLRVQLRFDDELASLPWEYMYAPDTKNRQGFFLATKVSLVLSRYMPVGKPQLEKESGKLRILIVVSQPDGLAPVVAEPVIEAIKQLQNVEVTTLDKPAIAAFTNALKWKPHVLHFIGHGRFVREENGARGEIALLEPDEQTVQWVPDRDFAEYFEQMHARPRLIILHQCEGGTADLNANFAGLAPQLIRAHIPAVVAMQHPITNRAAIAFSTSFYRELAKGEPIDSAVQSARWQITLDVAHAYDSRVFGTPVLYFNSRDGIIQQLTQSGGTLQQGLPPSAPAPQLSMPAGDRSSAMPSGAATLAAMFFEVYDQLASVGAEVCPDPERTRITATLDRLRADLNATPQPEWAGVLQQRWYLEPDGTLKTILFSMTRKVR